MIRIKVHLIFFHPENSLAFSKITLNSLTSRLADCLESPPPKLLTEAIPALTRHRPTAHEDPNQWVTEAISQEIKRP